MRFLEKYGDVECRALSWKQPFASLMLHDKIETRVWDSKYRGWVLICASKQIYTANEIKDISGETQFTRIADWQTSENLKGFLLPNAKAIAVGFLVGSRFMTKADEGECFVEYQEPWLHTSKKTGKKSWKRLWCHVYENVQPIEPFNWIGTQGWSTINTDIKNKIILTL
jgi:hypothetical protein